MEQNASKQFNKTLEKNYQDDDEVCNGEDV